MPAFSCFAPTNRIKNNKQLLAEAEKGEDTSHQNHGLGKYALMFTLPLTNQEVEENHNGEGDGNVAEQKIRRGIQWLFTYIIILVTFLCHPL